MKQESCTVARPIILSNSRLHVGINLFGEVHDFYYPHVGLENHAAAKSLRHRVGVWVDGAMSWLDDGSWQFSYNYHKHTLVSCIRAHQPNHQISVEFDDAVDSEYDVFMRNIHVINHHDSQRDVRLFMHQVFNISDSSGNGDTVQYLPDSDAVFHYRGCRYFAVGGAHASSKKPFDQYSVGLFGIEGHTGTYVDAEDGELSKNNVEHGRVDSVIGFNCLLPAHESSRFHYWIAAGKTDRQALDGHDKLRDEGALHRLLLTSNYWHKWVAPAVKRAETINQSWQDSFIKSILLIKAHISASGAIIASTDTTMLKYSRDAYTYCWTRDAAYALWPLVRLGYSEEPLAFFDFCKRVLHPGGYLMHKYQPDGSLGSSWHTYLHSDGTVAPPIQEDETAIVLLLFSEYYERHQDKSLLDKYYDSLVKKMADFLSTYVDSHTNLPKPSYDLWEERFLTTTYTTAIVYRSLIAATELAEAMDDAKHAVLWRTSADDMYLAAHDLLFNKEANVFFKGRRVMADGYVAYDKAVDASAVLGASLYGLFEPESDEMKASIQVLREQLSMPQDGIIGICRYQDDYYNRVSLEIPGNPWFIPTLWLAQYYLSVNKQKEADEIVEWCRSYMMDSGVLSEQINPYTKQYVSVAPLCWSQSEYAMTLLDYTVDS